MDLTGLRIWNFSIDLWSSRQDLHKQALFSLSYNITVHHLLSEDGVQQMLPWVEQKQGRLFMYLVALLVCLFFLYGQTGTERSRPLTAHWRPSFFLRCVRPEWLSLLCMCVCLRQTAASQCDVRRKVFGKGRGKANKKSKPYKQFFLKGIHPGTVYFCDLPGIWGQCARILFLPSAGKLPKTRWRTWKTDTMFLLK